MALLLDLTVGPTTAPEVAWSPISGEYWISWISPGTRIDVKLADREQVRSLVRAALAAVEEQDREEAHALSRSGIA
ncbi:MAG: hypothetical protein MUQ56_07975 [Thermoleophilia bacterium]|nr:hypothetical protein [Thermoleophilia bacterium]